MADIGEKLREAREAKGLSIADVEQATKIQSRYLTAIEHDEFDKLPGDFYVRAFIRQYAQIVGLDGKELLSDYHEDVPAPAPDEYVENDIDNKSEEVRKTTNNKRELWQQYLPRVVAGLAFIAVMLGVYVLYAKLTSGNGHKSDNENQVTVSSQSAKKKQTKQTQATVKTPTGVVIKRLATNQFRVLNLGQKRKLVVRAGANQAVFAVVALDGVTNYQATLAANEKHTMLLGTNVQSVVISFGYDQGTSISIGGRRVPYQPINARNSITLLIGNKGKVSQPTGSTSSSQTQTQTSSGAASSSSSSSTSQSSQSSR